MNANARTILLFAGLVVLVALGLVWIASDLRRQPAQGVAAPVPAAAEPPPVLHPELEAGTRALDEGRLDEARELLARVPADDPGHALALDRLGVALERAGDLEGARAKYREVVALQPDNPEPRVALAWTDYRLGDLREAELNALRALEISPGHVAARWHVALYRVAQGRIVDAVPAYARALVVDTDGRYRTRAEGELRELAARRPDLPDAQYALAFLANKRGDRAEEVALLERYLEMAPDGVAAATARARLDEARRALAGDEPAAEDS